MHCVMSPIYSHCIARSEMAQLPCALTSGKRPPRRRSWPQEHVTSDYCRFHFVSRLTSSLVRVLLKFKFSYPQCWCLSLTGVRFPSCLSTTFAQRHVCLMKLESSRSVGVRAVANLARRSLAEKLRKRGAGQSVTALLGGWDEVCARP